MRCHERQGQGQAEPRQTLGGYGREEDLRDSGRALETTGAQDMLSKMMAGGEKLVGIDRHDHYPEIGCVLEAELQLWINRHPRY